MSSKRDWFSGKILRCHPSSVGEPWVRFPDHAETPSFCTIHWLSNTMLLACIWTPSIHRSVIGLVVKFSVAIRLAQIALLFELVLMVNEKDWNEWTHPETNR
ncbi:hypothetical protein BGZ63DRAFT_427437 [Mariannaea sp. PMI_226]|nr:hypothetical protein BGZ63DRAFT_427437 [Mariannaea sp. PMI_226]